MLTRIACPNACSSERIRPLIGPDNRAHFEGLENDRLLLPRCAGCSRMRPPLGPICPWCADSNSSWEECSGTGVIHSWARYHRSFLDEFGALIPYVVVLVELDEGPILGGRLHDPPDTTGSTAPFTGQRVVALSEHWIDGFCGLAFRTVERIIP